MIPLKLKKVYILTKTKLGKITISQISIQNMALGFLWQFLCEKNLYLKSSFIKEQQGYRTKEIL